MRPTLLEELEVPGILPGEGTFFISVGAKF
jgi:hypothetical protein